MQNFLRILFLLCFSLFYIVFPRTYAAEKVLNVYVWFGEIPDAVIEQFQKETGIKVNYSTYDSNETLYAKLKASGNPGYDIIEPSSYYVDRMRKEGMLEKIDKSKLSHYRNLNPLFLNTNYDPQSQYSIPFLWGITGIFVNKKFFSPKEVTSWLDFWGPQFKNQIMLLDDAREVFSMALISLGYSADDNNPEHIKNAYEKLLKLWPNIKLFNSNAMPSIPIDEDAVVGMAWNGDIYKAHQENSNVEFVFPKDGFVIWVDNFSIPKNAPHPELAYKFLNFMLRGDIAAQSTKLFGYATANSASKDFLPKEILMNPIIFPNTATLKRGQFQTDVGDKALALYDEYWELLKLGGGK